MSDKSDSVSVAVRVRPLLPKDVAEGARECLRKLAGTPQLVLGADRSFTFDHVFEPDEPNGAVFDSCARDLVQSTFEGYNSTIFAYGQTGSGKTHTMGSSFQDAAALAEPDESTGLIPRALAELFAKLDAASGTTSCKAKASFIEIYKEEVHDLLSWSATSGLATLPIREDASGGISLAGQQQRAVRSLADAIAVLTEGGRNRATGATSMNATSSRSHAVFTLSLELRIDGKSYTPKMHFVDLAGSERAKRTGASGARLQEGIQINKGLLALGNVINALCERHSHVPYRDSKLTRLLQDSLGGNSRTVMLACVSPSDADLEETLNTLKYASRARFIKNKVAVAQDPTQARIAELEAQVAQLQARLTHYENGGAPLPALAPPALSDVGGGGGGGGGGSKAQAAALAQAQRENAQQQKAMLRRCEQLEKSNATLRQQLSSALAGASAVAEGAASSAMAAADAAAAMEVDGAEACGAGGGGVGGEREPQSFEEEALAAEAVEEELRYVANQGEIAAELSGLDKVLQLKQAMLAQQQQQQGGGGGGGGGGASEEGAGQTQTQTGEGVASLTEALALLEGELATVSKQREGLAAQMEKMEKMAQAQQKDSAAIGSAAQLKEEYRHKEEAHRRQLEALTLQLKKLKEQKAAQQAQLKARIAADARTSALRAEVDQIKAHKVALARRMREASELHRAQKHARDNELKALRRKEERTAAQLASLQGEHAKQAAVLKRKNEEVAAAQKRMRGGIGEGLAATAAAAAAARRPGTAPSGGGGFGGGGGGFGGGAHKPSRMPMAAVASTASQQARLEARTKGGASSDAAADRGGGGDGHGGTHGAHGAHGAQQQQQQQLSILGAKPREWLENEVGAAVAAQQLREQIEQQVEMRRQVARKLHALDAAAEQAEASAAASMAAAAAAAAGGGVGGASLDMGEMAAKVAAAAARETEGEALRVKRELHSATLRELQARLLQAEAAEGHGADAKLEALSTLPRAKALLKLALPRIVDAQLAGRRKDAQLETSRRALDDAAELAEGLRAQLQATRREAEAKAQRAEADWQAQLAQLQQTLDSKAAEAAAAASAAAQAAAEATAAAPPPPPPPEDEEEEEEEEEEDAEEMSALERRLQQRQKAAPAAAESESEEESEEEESEDDDDDEDDEEDDANWSDTEEAVVEGAVRRNAKRGAAAAKQPSQSAAVAATAESIAADRHRRRTTITSSTSQMSVSVTTAAGTKLDSMREDEKGGEEEGEEKDGGKKQTTDTKAAVPPPPPPPARTKSAPALAAKPTTVAKPPLAKSATAPLPAAKSATAPPPPAAAKSAASAAPPPPTKPQHPPLAPRKALGKLDNNLVASATAASAATKAEITKQPIKSDGAKCGTVAVDLHKEATAATAPGGDASKAPKRKLLDSKSAARGVFA